MLKRIGVTLFVAGAIMMFVPDLLDSISIAVMPNWLKGVIAVCGIFAFPVIFAGAFLFWRGRQYTAKSDAERILIDSNPDVLYLRTFRTDTSTAKYLRSTFVALTGWGAGLTTEEEQLADVLRPFGDLVAIGQPGERLPKPGAVRIYASDEEWKEVVQRQMLAARLVVIRAGMGENLLWELEKVVETSNPQKVLILVLNMKVKHYESFRTKANSILTVPLPEGTTLRREFTPVQFLLDLLSFSQGIRFGRVSGFLGFAADWKPSFFPLRAPYKSRSFFANYRAFFKFALRPVFETFGLEWQPPPVSTATTLAKAAIALFGLLTIIVGIRSDLAEGTVLVKAGLGLVGLLILINVVRLAVLTRKH